ncbi:MAG: PspA/IM30 family protein [Chloroherpetonaceae bacterium]|nr:PspA/IM30 family protein [Chloroherpetonaceae bacterium]
MNLFKRIFKVTQSEAHSIVDKLEDPIKLTEQGIRDLKNDLQQSMMALAQVKASAVRLRKDGEDQQRISDEMERKAMLLLQRAQKGEINTAEAEKLALEAMNRKNDASQRAVTLITDGQKQQAMADQLQSKIEKLKNTITKYENELITLRARAQTAQATRKINQQLSNVDSGGTVAMLEKMKTKVIEEESLAEAYGQLADVNVSLDEKIEKALAEPSPSQANDTLAELKRKMGILPPA